jgi:hypothetical protein
MFWVCMNKVDAPLARPEKWVKSRLVLKKEKGGRRGRRGRQGPAKSETLRKTANRSTRASEAPVRFRVYEDTHASMD